MANNNYSNNNNNNNIQQRRDVALFATTTADAESSSSSFAAADDFIVDPVEREAQYGKNNNIDMAQYLLDLHNAKATFNFCGGMMFQLVLTPALQEYLKQKQQQQQQQQETAATAIVVVHDDTPRMQQIIGYQPSGAADNVHYFHGRELRQVPHAAGGMGMVLKLSLAPPSLSSEMNNTTQRIDPQGWSLEEMQTYNGWQSDRQRVWRTAQDYEDEGFENFIAQYGAQAYGLHHRFYFHQEQGAVLWLAAEDGCEGTPAKMSNDNNKKKNPFQSLLQQFL